MAEKVRRLIDSEPFLFDNITIPVSISMGVADLAEYTEAAQSEASSESEMNPFLFIKLADDRLFEAKKAGRNRVVA